MIFFSSDMNRQRKESSAQKTKKATEQKMLARVHSERKRFETDYSNLGSPRSDYQLMENSVNRSNNPKILEQQEFQSQFCSGQLNKKRVAELYNLFKKNDKGNHEYLDISEFQSMIEDCGYKINITTCRGLFKQIKQMTKPGIYFGDLIEFLKLENFGLDSERDLKIAFQVYDKRKQGAFAFEDYQAVARTLKHKFSQEQLRSSFELMDLKRDGVVDYQQFKAAMQKK